MRFIRFFICAILLLSTPSLASNYRIDPTHSFIQIRVQHLGYSWLLGRFNTISGIFNYDPAAGDNAQNIEISVNPASIDTNHAERDKHLRSDDFLNVEKFGKATFKSTSFTGDENGGVMTGNLMIHGVSKEVQVQVSKIGEGKDPWGGYRAGFEGRLTITRSDFDMDYNLGPKSNAVEMEIYIEGIRR